MLAQHLAYEHGSVFDTGAKQDAIICRDRRLLPLLPPCEILVVTFAGEDDEALIYELYEHGYSYDPAETTRCRSLSNHDFGVVVFRKQKTRTLENV